MQKQFYFAALSCLMLGACAQTGAYEQPSLTEEKANFAQSDVERQLVEQSRLAHQQFEEDGLLVEDGAMVNYVRQVGQPLIPFDLRGQVPFRFFVLRDATPNAFAFPNGDMYITQGLLGRLETEGQLAFVLAHELSHIIHRHSLEAWHSNRDTRITSMVAGIAVTALTGSGAVGSLAQLPFLGSMFAYSRANEREADAEGLKIISAMGYQIGDVSQYFKPLEVRKVDHSTSIWSTHGKHEERVKDLQQLIDEGKIAAHSTGKVGRSAYAPLRHMAIHASYKLLLAQGYYEQLRDLAIQERKAGKNKALAYYFEAESWRMTAANPYAAAKEHAMLYDKRGEVSSLTERFTQEAQDSYKKALPLYNRAIRAQPDLPEAYRGRGLTAYGLGDYARAHQDLRRYLNQGAVKYDAAYINSILAKIQERSS